MGVSFTGKLTSSGAFSYSCQVTSAKFSRMRGVVGVALSLPSGRTAIFAIHRAFMAARTCRSSNAQSMMAMK